MDFQALVIIGTVMALLGGGMLFIARLWLKRMGAPANKTSPRMTKDGLVMTGVLVVALIVGFSAEYWAASSWFGQLVSKPGGRISYAMAVALVTILVQRILRRHGRDYYDNSGREDGKGG